MNAPTLNLFIVDDDSTMVKELRSYLSLRFGSSLAISSFYNGESALRKVDKNTSIVILDYNLKGENGSGMLKSIKKINPKTKVIMLTSNENIGIAIDSFRKGASNYVLKGNNAGRKIAALIYRSITYPVRVIVKELRVSKLLAIFLLTFTTMGIAVYIALKFVP